MNIGESEIPWDMGWESARDLLSAIQIVCSTTIKRVDGDDFSVYKVANAVRVDLKPEFFN